MHMEKFDGRLPFILHTIGESPRQLAMSREIGPDFNQFIWVKSGKGRFVIDGDTHVLGAGEGMFMRNRVPHFYAPAENSFYTVWFTFFCDENLIDYCIGDRKYIIFKVPDFLEKETEMLRTLARSSSSLTELSAAGYTYVTELFSAITQSGDDIIVRVREYLENNCHRSIGLDDIAASVELDKFALCRYFAKRNDRSVMDELKAVRIKKAKRLLRYSTDNIETVGMLCGFCSPSYFSLKFREECGCTPREYRARLTN